MGFWRSKPLDQRFQETYDFIRGLGVQGLDAGIALMDLRTGALGSTGQLDPLIQLMSLGFRWEIRKSADETRRRNYIRSVLFAYGTLGDPDQGGRPLTVAEITAKKNSITNLSETDLNQLLTRMLQRSVQTEGQRTFVGFDTTLEKANSVWALDRIAEAITKVQMALGVVSRNTAEAARFGTWFGASSHTSVRTNYGNILQGIRGGIILIKDSDPAKDRVFGYVYPNGPNNPPRVYLCAAFWRAGKVTWRQVGGTMVKKDGRDTTDNPLGVILHELSHLFVPTDDHRYGQADCKQLAISTPALACLNADNYEYYAEAIMANS